jgi:hypothetical protein
MTSNNLNKNTMEKSKHKFGVVILRITQNKKDEFQILRDGSVLRSYDKEEVEIFDMLRIATHLAINIRDSEKFPVIVFDAVTTKTPCCPNCGGINVSTKMWQNLKSGSLDSVSTEEDDNYCNDCEKHVELDEKTIKRSKEGFEVFSTE